MVRTILTWRILGEDLVGTRHVATPGRAGGLSGAPSVGILLLNSGSAARSGNSDLSARIGDRLALRGFPVFRFDLPGLGDSSGPTPADLESFWSEVVNGRNDASTVALIERIQLEFAVARVVVGGLCAAALPAVRALERAGAAPAGFILLEAELPPAQRAPTSAASRAQRPPRQARERGSPRSLRARSRSRGSARARAAHASRAPARRASTARGASAAGDANVALITRWQESLSAGVHSLIVVAAEQPNDRYVARVLECLPARARGAITCVRVPDTNHLFCAGAGHDAVLGALERWALEHFVGKAEPAVAAGRGR
jgi:pimeloyl-ACP methyl ester carboxylesterase